eukprot:COSAG04_NODE_12207_length_664_cov_21.961062_2_plen_54_part_01
MMPLRMPLLPLPLLLFLLPRAAADCDPSCRGSCQDCSAAEVVAALAADAADAAG